MNPLIQKIFKISPSIRYVAIYQNGNLESQARSDLENASSADSDKYEELIVNPVILKLVQQRGDIDCGGAKFVIVRYGGFYQWIQPIDSGHISIAIELNVNPFEIILHIEKELAKLMTHDP